MLTHQAMLVDPATGATVWYTPEDAQKAFCTFQPCGSSTCPCAAGMPAGTIPGIQPDRPSVPGAQVLPDVTTTVDRIVRSVPAWVWIGATLVALWALNRRRPDGRRQDW